VVAQGRAQEALEILDTIDESSVAPDPEILINRRSIRGRAPAALGRSDEAIEAAQEAVAMASRTEFLIFRGDSLLDLADALRTLGRPAETHPLVEEAVRVYQQKGAVVPAAKAKAVLDELAAL
jgi:hypothetical protein